MPEKVKLATRTILSVIHSRISSSSFENWYNTNDVNIILIFFTPSYPVCPFYKLELKNIAKKSSQLRKNLIYARALILHNCVVNQIEIQYITLC